MHCLGYRRTIVSDTLSGKSGEMMISYVLHDVTPNFKFTGFRGPLGDNHWFRQLNIHDFRQYSYKKVDMV